MIKVAIIGGGEIGCAIASLLEQGGQSLVEVWDKDEARNKSAKELSQVVCDAQVVFMCVPSWVLRIAGEEVKKSVGKEALIVAVSKGIEKKTNDFADQVLADVFSQNQIALLYGPMLAEELSQGLLAAAVVATENEKDFEVMEEIFRESNLRVEYSGDIRGVAVAGVMKNIYAIGLGAIVALDLGDNAKGQYIQMACGEMAEIILQLQGQKETAYSLAGLGDLIATGTSKYSSNHCFGQELVDLKGSDIKSEGEKSLVQLLEKIDEKDFNVLLTVRDMVLNKKNPEKVLRKLLAGGKR